MRVNDPTIFRRFSHSVVLQGRYKNNWIRETRFWRCPFKTDNATFSQYAQLFLSSKLTLLNILMHYSSLIRDKDEIY